MNHQNLGPSNHKSDQTQSSSDTVPNSCPPVLVETLEHRRFIEFCDACRRYGYIGLCYGTPGVGKTLSARSYSRWDVVRATDPRSGAPLKGPTLSTVFYTPSVVNTPGSISSEIGRARDT